MEEDEKIAAQKSGRLSFYVVNAIADGCTIDLIGDERASFFIESIVKMHHFMYVCNIIII